MSETQLDWRSLFQDLNDWLNPDNIEHWLLQDQFRQIGIPTPNVFKEWCKRNNVEPFLMKHLVFKQQFCLSWHPANVSPHRLKDVRKCGDLILGVRWKTENATPVTINANGIWFHDVEPCQLTYPYHMNWAPFFLKAQGPSDLEFLWCKSRIENPNKGLFYIDRYHHETRFQSVLYVINQQIKKN